MITSKTIGNSPLSKTSLHLFLKAIVFSSAFYFFSFITADPDLWGHIKFGKDLWISKAIHHLDIYSYTAYGREWINHEWLSEILMYMAYNIAGSPGLLIGKLLIGLTIVYILSRISFNRTSHPLIYGPVFVLVVFVISPGFMIRPQVLTFLFTSLFLYIFHLYLERKKNFLFFLPLIMILWVNCHGGFLIGVGMFPIVVISEIISCRLKKKGARYLGSLIFWFLITEFSAFINPYGYHLLIFLYKTLSTSRNIWEWQPVNLFDLSYLRFKLLTLLFICTLFFRKNERRYWEMGIIMLALLYAFKHQRHTPIFAIVAAPYLTEHLTILAQKINLQDRIKSLPSYLILNIFLIVLIGYQLFFTSSKYIKNRCNIIVDPLKYPVYATHFLKENEIKGNILLPFEWGEYAIWKLYPDCKVSVDGRFRTVYPQEIIDDHFGISDDESRWKQLLSKYPTDIILAKRNLLSQRLISTQGEWIYIYSDRISIIFIKNKDSQKDIIEKLKRKELKYPHKKLSIYFP